MLFDKIFKKIHKSLAGGYKYAILAVNEDEVFSSFGKVQNSPQPGDTMRERGDSSGDRRLRILQKAKKEKR